MAHRLGDDPPRCKDACRSTPAASGPHWLPDVSARGHWLGETGTGQSARFSRNVTINQADEGSSGRPVSNLVLAAISSFLFYTVLTVARLTDGRESSVLLSAADQPAVFFQCDSRSVQPPADSAA
jgi:hypothetical protein